MISILHHGNTGNLFCVCQHCGCEFSYTERDIMADNLKPFVECPDCRDRIGLYETSPDEVMGDFDQWQKRRHGFVQDGHFVAAYGEEA